MESKTEDKDKDKTEDDVLIIARKKSIEERLADIEELLYNPFIGIWESTYGPMYFYADNTGQMYRDDGIVFSEFFWKYDNINDVLVVKYNWDNNKVGILKIKNNNSDKLEGSWEQGTGKLLFSYDDILPDSLPHSGKWSITNRKLQYTLKRKENFEFEEMKKKEDGRKTNKKRSKSKRKSNSRNKRKSKKRTNKLS